MPINHARSVCHLSLSLSVGGEVYYHIMVNPSTEAQLSWLSNVSEVEKETNWWASYGALITTGVNINFNNTAATAPQLEQENLKPSRDLTWN